MTDTELQAELDDIREKQIAELTRRLVNCEEAAENSAAREQLREALESLHMVSFHMERARYYA